MITTINSICFINVLHGIQHDINMVRLTLHARPHRGTVLGHRETAAHVINFAQVCIKKLQA